MIKRLTYFTSALMFLSITLAQDNSLFFSEYAEEVATTNIWKYIMVQALLLL